MNFKRIAELMRADGFPADQVLYIQNTKVREEALRSSLRDDFAKAALAIAAQDEKDNPTDKSYRAVAVRAYHYAGAMLSVRGGA